VYGQLVGILGKYSKFASAGEKATLRQAAVAPLISTSEDAPF
jgi:myo-inositol-1(or 4)-monophosphatase